MDLYRRMEELRGTKKFEISVSYLEVKNAALYATRVPL